LQAQAEAVWRPRLSEGSGIIQNAGEFNGFLKPNVRLFAEPLASSAGNLVLRPGFAPTIDADILLYP